MKGPYETLGVSRKAGQPEIKKAYRRLAKDLHPDLHPGDAKVAERFKEVSAAYELLSDPKKRARFDRGEIDATGAERKDRTFYWSFAEDEAGRKYHGQTRFDEFFKPEDTFADLFGGRGARGHGFRMRGSDVTYTLRVGFLEAARGAKKEVRLARGKTLKFTIPPGTGDRQTLRLKGQGNAGLAGGPPGDAFIEIQVEPHRLFSRKGDDVHVEMPVTLQEAVLGGKITVPTIDGKVSLNVPKGSNTGTTLRLKGKGIVNARTKKRGDQYVRLKVVLPDPPDKELAALIRKWAPEHEYDVRGTMETK